MMLVFGTRPEAIKMAPVAAALRGRPGIEAMVAVTAQHRHMLDQVMGFFGIVADEDLDLMLPSQTLPGLFARILTGMTEVLSRRRPDMVLVHGDTSTTLATALAAFYAHIPVAHVEAGLRTGDMSAPWPEEANRRLAAPLASLHFSPTARARDNLLAEGCVPASIHVTGNTVIDALLGAAGRIATDEAIRTSLDGILPPLDEERPTILVTSHRRENFGAGMESICGALSDIVEGRPVQIVFPVHPNPSISGPVHAFLGGHRHIHLVPPLDYLPFVRLMSRSHLVLTDSGGVQEEAPSLGKPVLVMRETTERPEAVEAGTVALVGIDRQRIVGETFRLLDDGAAYAAMSRAHNPYGDGQAAGRIANLVVAALSAGEDATA